MGLQNVGLNGGVVLIQGGLEEGFYCILNKMH